jgi:predicted RNA-binding protein associated with RNAse of E/G family
MPQVTIELTRIGKPPRTYTEGLLSDNGIELRTHTELSPEVSLKFSRGWQEAGCFSKDQYANAVRKILFYHEYFAIMQLLDYEKHSLGCYVDITTPLQKTNGIYRLTDLILDLWITPDGRYDELDVDEFTHAVATGKLNPEWELLARQTFSRLKAEIPTGEFPGRYLIK